MVFGVVRLCSIHSNARTRSIQFRLISSFALFDPISLSMCAQSKFYLIVSAAARTQCSVLTETQKIKAIYQIWLLALQRRRHQIVFSGAQSMVKHLISRTAGCIAFSLLLVPRTYIGHGTAQSTHTRSPDEFIRMEHSRAFFGVLFRRSSALFLVSALRKFNQCTHQRCIHNITILEASAHTLNDFSFDIDAFSPKVQQIATF